MEVGKHRKRTCLWELILLCLWPWGTEKSVGGGERDDGVSESWGDKCQILCETLCDIKRIDNHNVFNWFIMCFCVYCNHLWSSCEKVVCEKAMCSCVSWRSLPTPNPQHLSGPLLKRDCAPARSRQLSSLRASIAGFSETTKNRFPVCIPHLLGCVIVGLEGYAAHYLGSGREFQGCNSSRRAEARQSNLVWGGEPQGFLNTIFFICFYIMVWA